MAKLCHYLYVCLVCERELLHALLFNVLFFYPSKLDLKAELTLTIFVVFTHAVYARGFSYYISFKTAYLGFP